MGCFFRTTLFFLTSVSGREGELTCFHAAADTEIGGPEYEDDIDMIQQDVVTCFLAAGADPEDKEDAELIAEAVDAEEHAYLIRKKARNHGIKVSKRPHVWKPSKDFSFGIRTGSCLFSMG